MAQKTLKKLALIVAASALCAGVFSCQKDADEKGGFTTGGDGTITFGVAFGNPSQDLTVKGSFELKDDAGNAIAMIEEATIDTPSPEQTKATLVNDLTGFGTTFQVSGFQGTAAYQGISNLAVTKQDDKYPDGTHEQWALSSPKSWPVGTDTTLEFFAWAPAAAWTTAPTLHPGVNSSNVEFSYTVTDALSQKDIMLAHYKGNGKDNTLGASSAPVAGVATMNFTHALSSVSFKASTELKDIKIRSIKLENIVYKADCAVSFDEASPYDWTPETTDATTSYQKDFGEEGITPEAFNALDPKEITFLLIPQAFESTSTAQIVLKITCRDVTYDVKYKLYDAKREPREQSTQWDAGKTTIYTIKHDGLDIEIDDEVEDDVKSNLEIKNVGGKPAYIRVLVTGAWVNTEGDIVALWDPANASMGTFTPAIFAASPELNDYRVKGADGFFYYTKVLPAGEDTVTPLFDSYVANEDGKPKNLKLSDHLEIDIVSQAVLADAGKASITKAWGATTAGYVDAMPTE